MTDQLPPHSIDAEEAVLAACLLDNDAIARALGIVQPEDFFREQNAEAYQACIDLFNAGEDATVVSAANALDTAAPDQDGWAYYLTEIAGKYFTAVGVEAHAKIIARDAYKRRMIKAAQDVASLAWSSETDVSKIQAESLGLVLGAKVPSGEGDPKRMGNANVLTDEVGTSTGVPAIDKYLDGLCIPGRLLTLAGPSGFGKSLLAGQLAMAVAEEGKHVLIASMEMDDSEYEWRLIQQTCGVRKRRASLLTEEETESVLQAQAYISTLPITFWNKARISLDQIRAKATVMKAEGLDLIVIDYLGLMSLPGSSRESEASRIGMITSGLKQLAVDLKVQVLLLSQMNRSSGVEMRSKDSLKAECILTLEKYPVPFIEALKGSSSVEQDSDQVVFLAKHPNCQPGKHISIVVGKNRHGETGESLMIEDFARARFRRIGEQECYDIAGSNRYKAKSLRIDQNWATWETYNDRTDEVS